MVHLSKMFEKYSERAEFLFVYTGETRMPGMGSHHQLPEALRQFAEPPGPPRKRRVRLASRVRAGKKHFGLHMPFLLDNQQCDVQKLYDASPKRLLVVDTAGRIVVDSGHAPTAAFPWKEAAGWLDRYSESMDRVSAEKRGS